MTLTLRSALFARVPKGEATGLAFILRDARSALLRMSISALGSRRSARLIEITATQAVSHRA
ncbi:hypothetical protein [Bradyrhizobium sp. Cp5.3]|uniref:hypothetical protein n=1 Tax=Bradyrhizobium sp. Cp5.3 TaxID=443598 RepID=UPI000480454C|nr:hypothetical protein [Bradyrhizobium sp. Cp5.3]